ncbi:hypothetical protein L1N85_19855 [Paenibacillus alkaliterrae]|uniref:hypothetical protein n=1 Tax=Paenibacillus alkaliterrae TaxID=320909 RepID=UPI0039F0EA20|nr:hypothetical protein [Paenibacillus alkaliterrae]
MTASLELPYVILPYSNIVISDFTEHKTGVYYEAGFAKGLGLEVIWTVREDNLDQCHFDTKQMNHIVWKTPENGI